MDDLTTALRRAQACAQGDDHAGELVALLDAWRLAPGDLLADLIEVASLRVEGSAYGVAHPLRRTVPHRDLKAVAALRDPRDVPWLLWAPNARPKDIADFFVGTPPDPRVARALPQLRRLARRRPSWMDPLVAHALPAAPVPAEAADLHARVTRPAAEARAVERAFLEQIWAEPDDDHPRRVYADWLLERGHPRGEFISLQLARVTSKRYARFLRRYELDWLGGVDPGLSEPGFQRGFVSSGSCTANVVSTLSAPEWATVTRLQCSLSEPDLITVATHPNLRSLREMHLHEAGFLTLARQGAPLRLRQISIMSSTTPSPEHAALLAAGERFPELRDFTAVGSRESLAWLVASPLAARLASLSLIGDPSDVDHWLAERLEGRFPGPRDLSLRHARGAVHLRDTSIVYRWRSP